MKYLYTISLLFLLGFYAEAQKKLPERRYSFADLELTDEDHPIVYRLGYSQMNLLNPEASNLGLKPAYGFYASIGTDIVSPLGVYIDYSSNFIKNESGSNYGEIFTGEMLHVQKIGAGMDLLFRPAANWLQIGLGAGYDLIFASTGRSFADKAPKQVASAETGSPYWRASVKLRPTPNFFMEGSYQQTFSTGGLFDHSQITGGIGWRIGGGDWMSGQVKEAFDERRTTLNFTYHTTNFHNTTFQEHVADGEISQNFGLGLNLRFNFAYPAMFDIGVFSSNFKVENIDGWPYADTVQVHHRGMELAICLPLLSATQYFVPYAGAGYQLSQLYVGPPISDPNNTNIEERSTNTSSPIWKIGLAINTKRIVFLAEYKHSIGQKERSFEQLSAGLGWRFGRD